MFVIQTITTDPQQQQAWVLQDGTQVVVQLEFKPMQLGWFFDSLVYGDFTLTGFRIVNSPNMLHQFRNQLPFGIACATKGNREPNQQQDFASGNSVLYLLSAAEVQAYTEFLSSGT